MMTHNCVHTSGILILKIPKRLKRGNISGMIENEKVNTSQAPHPPYHGKQKKKRDILTELTLQEHLQTM